MYKVERVRVHKEGVYYERESIFTQRKESVYTGTEDIVYTEKEVSICTRRGICVH